jgi:excisionase family DNA binding protein
LVHARGKHLNMTATKNPLLTVTEICELLGISRSSFDKWRRRGVGPAAIKLPNGHLRFRQSDLDAWIESLTIEDRETARTGEIQDLYVKGKKIPLRLYGPPTTRHS